MRLNGWMRIGVVLSVLWMVGGSVYAFHDFTRSKREYSDAMYNWRSACIGENAKRRMNNQPEQTCVSLEEVKATFKYDVPWLAFVAIPFVVLILAWIVIGITYVSVRWIRKGFNT